MYRIAIGILIIPFPRPNCTASSSRPSIPHPQVFVRTRYLSFGYQRHNDRGSTSLFPVYLGLEHYYHIRIVLPLIPDAVRRRGHGRYYKPFAFSSPLKPYVSGISSLTRKHATGAMICKQRLKHKRNTPWPTTDRVPTRYVLTHPPPVEVQWAGQGWVDMRNRPDERSAAVVFLCSAKLMGCCVCGWPTRPTEPKCGRRATAVCCSSIRQNTCPGTDRLVACLIRGRSAWLNWL